MTNVNEVHDSVVQIGQRTALVRHKRAAHPTEKPALLLLHGAGSNHLAFEELLDALAPDLDVFVAALPGRLDSSGPAPRSVAEAAQFVREVSEALGLRHFVAAGHSYGGAVALELAITAAQESSRVHAPCALILMATGARLRVHPAILQSMERAAQTGQPNDALRAAFRPNTPHALIDAVCERMARTPPSAALADWQAANAFDRMAALARLALPTLVLAGADDALTPPKYAEYMATQLRNARLVLLEGAGHMLPNERALDTARHIEAFVSTL